MSNKFYLAGMALFILLDVMMWICTFVNVVRFDPSASGWGGFSALFTLTTGILLFIVAEQHKDDLRR